MPNDDLTLPGWPDRMATRDGLALQLQAWPAGGRAHGSVLIVHGLGEHIGRYRHVATQLNAWGWDAFGYDQRGHGRSEGRRGAIAQADDLLYDLAAVIDTLRAARPGMPLVLLGHSMGGLVAARFAAGGIGTPAPWWRPLEALALSSPALDPGMNTGQRLLLAVLGPLAPGLAVANGLKPEWISRDAQVVRNYVADPLVHDRVTPRLVRFIVDGGEAVAQCAGDWPLPTLLMWAGSDRCVAPAGSAGFAAAAPQARVVAHEFRALYHEIFNEPEQADVFAVLREWLRGLAPAEAESSGAAGR